MAKVIDVNDLTDLMGVMKYTGDRATLKGDIILPEGINIVSGFNDCSEITSVVIPEGVTKIDGWAFKNCKKLERVSLPSTLTALYNGAFVGCDSLAEIFIPEMARVYIGGFGVFSGERFCRIEVHEKNPYHCSVDGVLYSKDMRMLQCFPSAKECDEFIVPDTVEQIFNPFVDCTRLRCIVVPDSVVMIEPGSFCCGCTEEIRFLGGAERFSEFMTFKNAFSWDAVRRYIAPEIDISLFFDSVLKQKAALGYAKAWINGWTTGSKANQKYEKYIRSQKQRFYPLAGIDIWMMRYMTEQKIIPAADIDTIMGLISDKNLEIKAVLLAYSDSISGGDIAKLYKL